MENIEWTSNCCEANPLFELDPKCWDKQIGYCSQCGMGAVFKCKKGEKNEER